MSRHEQWVLLDNFRRKLHIKHELKRALLKSVVRSKYTPLAPRYLASFNLATMPRIASRNKIRNRCVVSGRTWNVIKRTQTSRFVLRHDAYFSNLPGSRRASW